MIDKLLMAARRAAAGYRVHRAPTKGAAGQRDADLVELMEQTAAAAGIRHYDRLPDAVIEADVDAFVDMAAAAVDYFHPGRSTAACKFCGAPLIWIKTPANANAPLDACPIDGLDANGEHHRIHLSHFSTCPEAERVRLAKAARTAAAPDGKSQAAQ